MNHSLSSINSELKTANCVVCGDNIPIYFEPSTDRWRCKIAKKIRDKLYRKNHPRPSHYNPNYMRPSRRKIHKAKLERLALADKLVKEGLSYLKIEKQSGVCTGTLVKLYGPSKYTQPTGDRVNSNIGNSDSWTHWKKAVLKNGYELGITKEFYESIRRQHCYYCGSGPVGLLFKTGGLDRIDSSKGYVPGNIRPCCKRCNHAKNDMTDQEFWEWLNHIQNHWQGPIAEYAE
jgi:hypothetical protein